MAETFDAQELVTRVVSAAAKGSWWAVELEQVIAAALTEAYMLGRAHGSGRKQQRGFHVDFPLPRPEPTHDR